MANFMLANADAVLVDYLTATSAYTANVPFSVSGGVLSASLLENGTALEQSNLVATFDGKPETTGTLPKLRLALSGSVLPTLSVTDFTLNWVLTAGLDGTRKPWVSATDLGEKQVNLTGLSVHIASVGNKILLYANDGQTISINAYRSSSNLPIPQSVSFSSADVLGEIVVENGQAILDFDFMSVVAKLDSKATLFSLFGYTPESLLSTGNYHLSVTGIPLANNAGAVTGLSVITPIAVSANQAPQLQAIADRTIKASVSLTLSAPDPESQTVTYSVLGGSDETVKASINNDSTLTLAPANGYTTAQPIEFTVKASDSSGAYTTQSFAVTVENPVTAHYWGITDKPVIDVILSDGVPQKTATVADKAAVNLLDAIAILKSIVGLQTLNSHQQIAADFDGTAGVDLNDAIGILKHVVGLPSAAPTWVFVEASDPTPNPNEVITVAITADTPVELTGILRGDVDGGWATQ